MERLSTRIRAIRKERHLSQKALAEMAGIAVNTLCHIEQGKDTSLSTLLKIEKALGITLF